MEQRLEGGNAGGAVLVDGTVRRPTGPWTPSVHALLRHLERRGFEGSPRALGIDLHGREILSFVPGTTIGTQRPWPAWVHSDDAVQQVGSWLRGYHHCVADFVPPADATWRAGSHAWRCGDVIGHNDAAPYNAVWQTTPDGRTELVGFIDWDFASPCAPIRDLAFVASAWVPLHNREAARSEGFDDFAARPRRLRLLLDAYGWTGTTAEVLDAVRARIVDHIRIVHELADGDPVFQRQVDAGAQADRQLSDIYETLRQFDRDRPGLDPEPGCRAPRPADLSIAGLQPGGASSCGARCSVSCDLQRQVAEVAGKGRGACNGTGNVGYRAVRYSLLARAGLGWGGSARFEWDDAGDPEESDKTVRERVNDQQDVVALANATLPTTDRAGTSKRRRRCGSTPFDRSLGRGKHPSSGLTARSARHHRSGRFARA